MDFLLQLQNMRSPLMDKIMVVLTYLGDEAALMVIGAIILWCVNKRLGQRTILTCLAASSFTTVLKGICAVPRPWIRDERLMPVDAARGTAEDFSFPSGHSTIAASAYGSLAVHVGKVIFKVIFVLIALLVAFTRLYLGVHTPTDVAVGLCVGLVFVAMSMYLKHRQDDLHLLHAAEAVVTALSIIALLCLALFKADLSNDAYYAVMKELSTLCGSLLGLTVGSILEERYVKYNTKTTALFQIIKVVGGLALAMGLRVILKSLLGMVLPDSPYTNMIRYFILMIFVMDIWPMFFRFFPAQKK